jgi:hypothetical protein
MRLLKGIGALPIHFLGGIHEIMIAARFPGIDRSADAFEIGAAAHHVRVQNTIQSPQHLAVVGVDEDLPAMDQTDVQRKPPGQARRPIQRRVENQFRFPGVPPHPAGY